MLGRVRSSGIRQRVVVSLAVFALSACATVVVAATSANSSAPAGNPPTVQMSSAQPSSTGPVPVESREQQFRIGLDYADTLPWKSDAALGAALDDAVELGAGWIRVDLSWNDIQPDKPDRYEWQRFDRVARAARARGLQVLAVIGYTPAWERQPGCTSGGQVCPPVDPALFAAFAADAAKRYAPMGVHTWEIWNEENASFWLPRPDPAAYAQLLSLTAASMRHADPKAYLVMGGLAAGVTDPKTGYLSAADFLTAVSKLGANKLVDAVADHPYTYPHLLSDVTTFGDSFERISSVKGSLVQILATYGTPNLPIWITEVGAPTVGPGAPEDGRKVTTGTHVTEQRQAEIAADSVGAAAANSHVDALFWFADQDDGKNPVQTWHYYGLRRGDGSKKPAFSAFQHAISAFRDQ